LFSGGSLTRIIHPFIGVVLILSFLGLFARFWKLNLWTRTDNVWLGHVKEVLAAEEDKLPEVGKYNAGQKLVFWSMSILIVLLFLTGVVIWQQYFSTYFTIEQRRVAVLAHSVLAIVAICVWIVH